MTERFGAAHPGLARAGSGRLFYWESISGTKVMASLLGRLFFAGFVRLHVLYHAALEPICGVDIVAELGRHGYRLSPGTLYPVLHELERAGYLTGWTEVVGGKRRRYYEATAAGRKALGEAKVKLRELATEVLDHQRARRRHSTRNDGR